MDKYRIRLENSRRYPRSVFWNLEEYSEKLGYYREVRRGVVSFFGKKAAMRAARRALKKYQKFNDYNDLYSLDGQLLEDPAPPYTPVQKDYSGNAYCVKCKESVDFVGKIKTSDSGRRIAMGTCPNCKTKVNRILPSVGSGK